MFVQVYMKPVAALQILLLLQCVLVYVTVRVTVTMMLGMLVGFFRLVVKMPVVKVEAQEDHEAEPADRDGDRRDPHLDPEPGRVRYRDAHNEDHHPDQRAEGILHRPDRIPVPLVHYVLLNLERADVEGVQAGSRDAYEAEEGVEWRGDGGHDTPVQPVPLDHAGRVAPGERDSRRDHRDDLEEEEARAHPPELLDRPGWGGEREYCRNV